jgi:hypothetical protein
MRRLGDHLHEVCQRWVASQPAYRRVACTRKTPGAGVNKPDAVISQDCSPENPSGLGSCGVFRHDHPTLARLLRPQQYRRQAKQTRHGREWGHQNAPIPCRSLPARPKGHASDLTVLRGQVRP